KLGLRVGTLDTIVKQSRKDDADSQGKAIVVVHVDPWPHPVDSAQFLDEIAQALHDHIVLTSEQADTIALWCTHTHGYEIWRISPRMGFRAPSKACGKTEALRRVKRLVARPVSCENLTTGVLFRLTDGSHPTLLLDETDNLLPEDKGAMLGVMNSGYE